MPAPVPLRHARGVMGDWGTVDTRFRDRRDAGRRLAAMLEGERAEDAIVVGLARGGVVVAAEVAAHLHLPLEALTVRKVGHPRQPEYGLGAVVVGEAPVIRASDGLPVAVLREVAADAAREAERLERRLRPERPPVDVTGRACILVDDGLATGSTMVAAVAWARAHEARRVVVAVPVAAWDTAEDLRREVDALVCVTEARNLRAVGTWFDVFTQVDDTEVVALLGMPSPPPTG